MLWLCNTPAFKPPLTVVNEFMTPYEIEIFHMHHLSTFGWSRCLYFIISKSEKRRLLFLNSQPNLSSKEDKKC